jgi:hypothetical protein
LLYNNDKTAFYLCFVDFDEAAVAALFSRVRKDELRGSICASQKQKRPAGLLGVFGVFGLTLEISVCEAY